MARRAVVTKRVAVVAIGALLLFSRFAATALAAPSAPPAPILLDCDPCVTVIDTPAWSEPVTVLDQPAFDSTVTIVDHEAYDETVTVVDQSAWDEFRTVIDRAAYDETITYTDVPERSVTRTIVDAAAYTVHHHDLVTAEHTVQDYVIVQPAHREPYQVWVVSSEPRQEWVTSGYYTHDLVPAGHWQETWVTSGYYTHDWISEGHNADRWVTSGYYTHDWVSSGYWYSYWVSSGYWSSYWVSSGYSQSYWVDTSHSESYSYWQAAQCWDSYNGWYYDCGYWASGSYWVSSGYWSSYWVDTSHWQSYWVDTSHYEQAWADTSHWTDNYHDTSHWETYWVDTSHYVDTYHDTSHWREDWIDTSYYVDNYHDTSHWREYNVDTSHYETAYRYVDDRYGYVDRIVPAEYRDWDELIAAVTHQESYWIPAVTHDVTTHYAEVSHEEVTHHPELAHTEIVSHPEVDVTITTHHDATYKTELVYHPAVGHLEQAPDLTSQSVQGAPPAGGSGGSGGPPQPPISIPVVTSITLVDTPARDDVVTVVDQPASDSVVTVEVTPASDEQVTVEDQAAWDETVTNPDGTTAVVHHDAVTHVATVHHDAVTQDVTVHHDAVTHTEVTHVPAITHDDPVSFTASVAPSVGGGGTDDTNGLLEFAALLGLVALAGAGRYASASDAVRRTLVEMAATGDTLPTQLAGLLTDATPTDAQVDDAFESVNAALDDAAAQLQDTPPSGEDPATAAARAQYLDWIASRPASATPASDPFAAFQGLPGFMTTIGSFIGPTVKNGAELVLNAPVVGGALQGGMAVLQFATDVAFETPAGAVALLADAGLETGLRDRVAQRMQAEHRPIWEAPKIASEELGKALAQIGEDPTVDPSLRTLAQGARATEFVLTNVFAGRVAASVMQKATAAARAADLVVTDVTGATVKVADIVVTDAATTTAVPATTQLARGGAAAVRTGQAGERAMTQIIDATLGDTGPAATQITMDTAAGTMRADQILRWAGNKLVNFESKVNTSRPSAAQLRKWKALAMSGARARGARAAEFELGNVDRMPTIVVRMNSAYEIVGADLAAGTLEDFPWAADVLDHLNGVIPVAP